MSERPATLLRCDAASLTTGDYAYILDLLPYAPADQPTRISLRKLISDRMHPETEEPYLLVLSLQTGSLKPSAGFFSRDLRLELLLSIILSTSRDSFSVRRDTTRVS